jgi:hypothetical protein
MAARLEMVKAEVGCDSPDPRTERPILTERVESLEPAQESLLGKILRLAPLTAEPEACVEYHSLVATDEVPICIDLTLSRAQHEGTVRGFMHAYNSLQENGKKVSGNRFRRATGE